MMRRLFRAPLWAGVMLVALSSAAPVFAQSDDAVTVLFNGGVETVEVFDLTAVEPREVTRLGVRRILPATIGAARVSDIKILPDGSHLLGDVNGRGAVVTSPDGLEVRWVMDDLQRLGGIDAATVGSYFAPGEPSLVVTGDSASSNVTIRNTSQGTTVWFDTVRLNTSRGVVPQVAVMPGNLLAIAINWPEAGVYGLRIRDTNAPGPPALEVSSATHPESPPDAVIVPELDVIRDLMVLEDGRFLVTTRFALVVLSADGTLDELIDVGDLPMVSGQLASARVLPSGLWALATFEPGQWVQPHVNHRVHWFDPETAVVIATSAPLSRAPLRVEPQAGHGGTGTVGFDAGLNLIQQGDPTKIELVSLVVPPTAAVGSFISVQGAVQNTGTLPVGLARLSILAAPGGCVPRPAAGVELAATTSVAINPNQLYSWLGDPFLDASFAVGDWCAFVQGRDQQGVLRDIGDPVEFTITAAADGTGTTIDVRPLPFNTGGSGDAGFDVGDAGDVGGELPDEKGCCSSIAARPDRRSGLFALLLLAISLTRRR